MIKVEGLTKRYARNVAVDHISFQVDKGQIVGFLGPNGAGKTTTMRMLTCFLPPTDGTAEVAGFDVSEKDGHYKGIGIIGMQERANLVGAALVADEIALLKRVGRPG